jgi:cellulose synthase/poly-beta-1,6-N-acetylglucosamine synthase-like glycosyltransferase/exo-beta-1,3-glucanase (GH17 family)
MRSVAAVVALAACLHAAMWAYFQPRMEAPDLEGPLASVSYTPFEGISRAPNGPVRKVLAADDPSFRKIRDQIRADLRAIAPYTNTIRTYSSTMGEELIAPIAAEFGLRVTVGIGIFGKRACSERFEEIAAKAVKSRSELALEAECKKFEEGNDNEIKSAIDLARRYRNVNAIVVGNETTLTRSKTIDELVALVKRVKRQVNVPVTTGETWDVWIEHRPDPAKDTDYKYKDGYKLASAVDFVAAHVLPYWDKATPAEAADHTVEIYRRLRHAHEGKHIMIAEFGYPSGGYNRASAEPGRAEQARIVREFVSRARALGIDYNVIEAYDQPWKVMEGSVGAYWGLFDTSRAPKFAWTGPITNSNHTKLAAIAVAAGLLVSLPILGIAGATLLQALLLAFASHVVGAWAATVFNFWNAHYFVTGSAFAFFFGTTLLIPLILIVLYRIQEIAAVLFGPKPRRLLPAGLQAAANFAPKVSIHIPAYMEPPEMLRATLDAVARLEYPNFECVVVINNTPDPAYWRPIEDHCQTLGERFKFINVDGLAGFKAGALRLALTHTAPDAEIIGVLDADYVVRPDWLKDLMPVFADPKVGLIQAPQDHRDGERTPLHRAMNAEYAGFFDIGMIERNESNAIIVHGTMCLVRRTALAQAGSWSSDTICEDTDLGLTILEQGWTSHYTNRRYGHGLLPDTFEAYKKQRHRWAYGGVQIARKHWQRLLPRATGLQPEQRREFAMGWLNWLGAESIGVIMAILNLAWVPIVAFVGIAIPDKILTLPILAAFVVSVVHFAALYRARVALSAGQTAAAMFAAMSMQWTVARAVGIGLVKDHLPFVRTAKGGVARQRLNFPAFNEAILAGLLILGAAVVFATNYEQVREINLFAWVLIVQSVPFIAAVALAALEDSRFNSFAFWRSLESSLALRPRAAAASLGASLAAPLAAPTLAAPMPAPAMVEATIVETVPAPAADQRVEAVQ